nr:MAG TPA: hypothetical protein [Caudoviricetes sp.]
MADIIIYKQPSGLLAVIHPAPEAVAFYGVEAIAKKDVPAGLPYKIIDANDLPSERSQRQIWTVDDADLTDGVGADWDVFPAAGKRARK